MGTGEYLPGDNESEPCELQSSGQPTRASARVLIAMAALMACHLFWLRLGTEAAYESPDGAGYAVQARLIATQGHSELRLDSDIQYVGYHWMETRDGRFFCRYPPGFPLLQGLAYALVGPAAGLWVPSLLATGLLLLVYLLARAFVNPRWAVAAAAVMAVNGVADSQALQNSSHNASAFFLVLGLWLTLRFAKTGRLSLGIMAGLALGSVPSIRYGEAIAALGVTVYLLRQPRPLSKVWPVSLGAVVPLSALALRNTMAFGVPWRTGYSLTGEQTAFSFHSLLSHLLGDLGELQSQGLLWFFALGAAGLTYQIVHSDRSIRDAGLLFTTICSSLLIMYMAFYFNGRPVQRFFLPAFPLMIVAAITLLAQLATVRCMKEVAVVLLLGQIILGFSAANAAVHQEKRTINMASQLHSFLARNLAPSVVLAGDPRYLESLDYTGIWRLADDAFLVGHEPYTGDRADLADYRQPGKNRLQRTPFAQLPLLERAAQHALALCAWSNSGTFYWIGPVPSERMMRTNLLNRLTIERIAELRFVVANRDNPMTSRVHGTVRGDASARRLGNNGSAEAPLRWQATGNDAGSPDLVLLRINRS